MECLLVIGADELVHVKLLHYMLRADLPVTRTLLDEGRLGLEWWAGAVVGLLVR